ncbi:MAG: hypothetical protein ACD_30C00076G0005 [uncultured bacterium]|uniref:DUF5671 domain-containing protein n=2 Tax=Candidatus Daviesiibacteriota TaxID=1752718 RepID=A0A1F5K020_9BACT|nr:MAG: hypothetical protein ACD_30C00076G0005 [uncultured bacterium]KKQ15979.1 MAG: hypothetical protein US28_C0007G0070 [Candidatus Daviesbacteria bacterium GW2011_GWA1_36_8]OGE33603.1 MAG: hypothetical protein A3C99_03285 [Candidatus Daviesbacteria bacterium RIFCSPHIGHO2_02_FULL_37_9]OGE34327.1 MAG: hypothetical protein A3E66_04890 [Candidatus Daviesbacteria bacterium RIFCSPHIGHO2_12_FULL_37_16]
MKKFTSLIITSAGFLASALPALALTVAPPEGFGIRGSTAPTTILSSALNIAFIVAAVVVLFFMVLGAFRWITSGGDKDAIANARKTIVNALIGLAILALSVVIVVVVGRILNIDITKNFSIKNLQGEDTPL